jgi:hypothetical protein
MECKNCHKKWDPDRNAANTLTQCPYCGANLADESAALARFDNSKDALAYIMRKCGIDVLLGNNLKGWLSDVAPTLAKGRKRVIASVYGTGAAKILKNNNSATQADKEAAFKQAAAKLVADENSQETSEQIIREFTNALGWNISVQVPTLPLQTGSSASQRQISSQIVRQSAGQGNVSSGTSKGKNADGPLPFL